MAVRTLSQRITSTSLLTDASQTAAFAQALNAIARKTRLSVTETASSGVIRFDCAFHGARTHTVHVITPLAARAVPRIPQRQRALPENASNPNPRLAIIIDDLGYDRSAADAVLALGFPLTVSVCRICRFPANSPKKRAAAAIR